MLTDKQPCDTYTDLLDERADAALVADLFRLHHPAPPSQLRSNIARALEQRSATMRVQTPTARCWARPFQAPRRFAVVLVALLAFTMLAAAAAPLVTSIVDKAFGLDAGTNRIVTQHLGKELGVSQTINGFTVTIERVYADANQIVIGYSVSGPPDRSFNNFLAFGAQRGQMPTLADDTGREFLHSPIGWGAGVEEGKGGYLLRYDAAPLGGNPAELNLHLSIGTLDVIERVNGGTPVVSGAAPRASPQKGGDAGPYCELEVCIYSVAGPFVFDFTIPFTASRVAELHQAGEIGGVPITLDRVSATPTGTLITLRGVGPEATVTLAGGGKKYALGRSGPVAAQRTADQPFDYTTTDTLLDDQREWILTVTTAQGTSTFDVTLP